VIAQTVRAGRKSKPVRYRALREQLAVIRRVAEIDLGALGPLEVEVGRVFPGKPMPPWIWMFSAAAWKYASEQYAFDSAATTGSSSLSSAAATTRSKRPTCRLDLEQMSAHLCFESPGTSRSAGRTARAPSRTRPTSPHLLRAAHHLVRERDRRLVEQLGERGEAVLRATERRRDDIVDSSFACFRVVSIVWSGVRVRPSASPATVKNMMPSVPVVPARRATTTIVSAVKPSITNIFSPDSLNSPPTFSCASIVMPAASHLPEAR